MVDDNSLISKIIIGVVIGIIVTSCGGFTLWQLQQNTERNTVSYNLLNEINQNYNDLYKYTDTNSSLIVLTPMYSQGGMYYIYGSKIFIFDKPTNTLLYKYYNLLLKIEMDRVSMVEYCYDDKDQLKNFKICRDGNANMHQSIGELVNMTSSINTSLNKYQGTILYLMT